MKLFRRFLMVLLPLIIIGGMFVFFPKLRPDISEFRELRGTDFAQGIEISKTGGTKTVEGYLNSVFSKGFIGFELGKIRIAIRTDEPYSPYARYLNVNGFRTYPILIDPPRTIKKKPKSAAVATTHAAMVKAAVPGMPSVDVTELPGGTRIEMNGKKMDFKNGEVTINGQSFSTTEKPLLIILREDHTIEMIEEIPLNRMPIDVVIP